MPSSLRLGAANTSQKESPLPDGSTRLGKWSQTELFFVFLYRALLCPVDRQIVQTPKSHRRSNALQERVLLVRGLSLDSLIVPRRELRIRIDEVLPKLASSRLLASYSKQ